MSAIIPGYYATLYEQDKRLHPAKIFIDNNSVINKFGGVKYRRFLYVSSNGTYVLTSVRKKK